MIDGGGVSPGGGEGPREELCGILSRLYDITRPEEEEVRLED